ncbi:MAG: TetR family transcriptional regulator, partial [Acidobacteriota bacterium]|nr:TetR family transcriptional regulator [Acidobacteriota bacterium]
MVQSTIRQRTERASETRGRILNAALQEFSANGLVGARTERIAGSAGVNKALLYYYFESKEKLYLAALEMIADKIRQRSLAVLQQDVSPGERLVRAALDHFDRILAQHEFQSLMQQEMMRHHKGEPGAMPLLVERVFAPLQEIYQATLREGIEMGELIDVDQLQMQLVALGANVFYFLSAPVWRMVRPTEPLAPEVLAQRRVALVEFLGQAVFVDRSHGAEVAARVLEDMP